MPVFTEYRRHAGVCVCVARYKRDTTAFAHKKRTQADKLVLSDALTCTNIHACAHTRVHAHRHTRTHTPLMRCIDWMILSWVSQPADTTCPLLESRRLTTSRLRRRVRGVHRKIKRNHLKKSGVLLFCQCGIKYFKKRLPGNIKGYFDSGQMSFFFLSFPCCRSLGILFRQR